MTDLLSIVIVRNEKGWIAHLRFADSKRDCDIGHTYKPLLYDEIEDYVNKVAR